MKFTNGRWLMRDGIDDLHTTADRAIIYAATSHIDDRSRTVNGPRRNRRTPNRLAMTGQKLPRDSSYSN